MAKMGAVSIAQYHDTDSNLTLHVWKNGSKNIESYYDALRSISSQMDFSGWSKEHIFYSSNHITEVERKRLLEDREKNRKKTGIYSDEAPNAQPVLEACLIKAKSYCLKLHNDNNSFETKFAMKGCRNRILDLKFEFAKRFLLGYEKESILYPHVTIESQKHELILRKTKKTACNRQFLKR